MSTEASCNDHRDSGALASDASAARKGHCGSDTEPMRQGLAAAVNHGGYFTLAFGAIVGSGWVVVMGEWLRAAGPGGAALGFLIGGVVMILIALCYGELAARSATSGAEFLYALQTFGPRAGFLVAWFITLYSVAACAFEGIACAWLLRALVPAITLGSAYTVLGVPVGWDALVIGGVGTMGIGTLHWLGASSTIRFQNVVTYGFIGVTALLVIYGLTHGSVVNLEPLVSGAPGRSWLSGAIWIFATCAFFLNGWQTALHAIEERRSDVTPRGAVISITCAIGASTIFYVGIIAAAASAVPWRTLVAQDLPAAAAFGALGLGGALRTVILVAATISAIKTWSAVTWIGSRVIYAQAKHGLLPAVLARVDQHSGAPRSAILAVVALTLVGIALGRGAILPIVDMVSLCLALSLILCLVILLHRRRSEAAPPAFEVPGGMPTILTALAGALTMVSMAVLQPLLRGVGTLPPEWVLLSAWMALGIVAMLFSPWLRRARSR